MKLTNKLTIKLKRHPHLTEPDNRAWWSSDSGIRTLSIMLLILAVMVIAIPPGGQAYITPVNAQKQNRKASGQAADKYQAELTAAVKSMQSEAARMERTETAKDHFTKLAQKMQSVQTMAVIIRLRLPYRTEVEVAGGVQSDAQRLMIRQVRERLLDQLAGYEPSSVKSYDYLPLVALRLNVAGMNSIQGLADALDIEEDEVLSPSLDQSSAKIGAVQAWADGYTGTGQTIAIIDSGVDKSHPFLANKVVSEACYSTTNSAYFATSLCHHRSSPVRGCNAAQVWTVARTALTSRASPPERGPAFQELPVTPTSSRSRSFHALRTRIAADPVLQPVSGHFQPTCCWPSSESTN